MPSQHDPCAEQRLQQIAYSRAAVLGEATAGACSARPFGPFAARTDGDWIERSWRRCLSRGQLPNQRVAFDVVSAQAMRRIRDEHQLFVQAARPAMDGLARATAGTRYFAILTDAHGVAVDVAGDIDHADPRAISIARVGVDLSEGSIGTSAISAALSERRTVWLHRGEHFFRDTSMYTCAGAPVFDHAGRCVGMLDLTGIDTPERPELQHLVARAARHIDNALTLRAPHRLLVRLNWPGLLGSGDGDGLLCLDEDGRVTGANPVARQIVSGLAGAHGPRHSDELFAMPAHLLFDAALRGGAAASMEVPLWSGLRVQLSAQLQAPGARAARASLGKVDAGALPLKDLELALVRQAVADARGNVAEAARALGISRATVYRKLGRKPARR